jgi:probable rRNA maturation factor
MIFVDISEKPHFPEQLMEAAARETLALAGDPEYDLTLVLTGDSEIQALNRDFLGHDAPTDVLSFPAEEADPESGNPYLGDVIISLPRAAETAKAHGHDESAEVQLLVVHGVLHLLGHDHARQVEKKRMWELQTRVLASLGLKDLKIEE